MEDVYVYLTSEDRKAIAAIPGLEELMNAIAAWDRYRQLREECLEGDNLVWPNKPEANVGELSRKYPRADAYLQAKRWRNSRSFKKSAIGQQGMDRILAGEDPGTVLNDMEKTWAAFKVAQGEG